VSLGNFVRMCMTTKLLCICTSRVAPRRSRWKSRLVESVFWNTADEEAVG
jgi:hypothetical protein